METSYKSDQMHNLGVAELTRFGLTSPNVMLSALGFYLLFIYYIGPRFMKTRKAYELKTFIIFYNIGQVMACLYILYRVYLATEFQIMKFWKCFFTSTNPDALEIYDSIIYFTFWLKMVELIETIIFVLRKKQNQVSYLHVFHHCSTITLVYIMGNNYRALLALYPLVLNCCVHVIMYTYYLAAAVCDQRTIQRLTPIKKSITIIQMIQFVLILSQAVVHFMYCSVPKIVVGYYATVVIVIFYGFYDFYKKAYNSNKAKQDKQRKINQKR